jgi:hypothetical protein
MGLPHTSLDQFIEGRIDEVYGLTAAEFALNYQRRKAVVAREAAAQHQAVRNWTLEYLEKNIGQAVVTVGQYGRGRHDYTDSVRREVRFAEFAARFSDQAHDREWYLFNHDSCVFWTAGHDPTIKTAPPNPGLACLAAEFQVPSFIAANDCVYASLILGGTENATKLHFDFGGEAKVLIQVRGRKRVLLFPPEQARNLYLHSAFTEAHTGHICAADPWEPDYDRFPRLRLARGFEVTLSPGDVLYWPSFWFHDVSNLDPFTLAISLSIDELPVSPLLVRHLVSIAGGWMKKTLETDGRAADWPSMLDALRGFETRVLSEDDRRRLWSWMSF